jgi:hypothetical protein
MLFKLTLLVLLLAAVGIVAAGECGDRRRRRLIRCILLAIAIPALAGVVQSSSTTYFDLYTGTVRTRHVVGFVPLPYTYSTREQVEWALQSMQDPGKRRWEFVSQGSRNLFSGGKEADAFPFDTVCVIYSSALTPDKKLQYLAEYHRDVDRLADTDDLHEVLYTPWEEKLKPFRK